MGLVRIVAFINPVRLWLVLRERFTFASVTLLLGGIISMNIVWGYPWTSMFAFCVSSFLIGLLVNGTMRPRLTANVSAPRAVECGEPANVDVQLYNVASFPALDFSVHWKPERHLNASLLFAATDVTAALIDVDYLASKQSASISQKLVWNRRGVVPIPKMRIESTFPFHLFRSYGDLAHGTTIAVTPRTTVGNKDEIGRAMHRTISGLITRIMSGDSMQYVGSREYQVGMPVVRWDFASWARLGRPIVREFSSPTVRRATLIIDLASGSKVTKTFSESEDEEFERLLSYAAYAIKTLVQSGVTLTLWTTDFVTEDTDEEKNPVHCDGGGDWTEMMIRLATVSPIASSASETGLQKIFQVATRDQIIVFSSRSLSEAAQKSTAGITWFSTSAGVIEK